MDEPEETKEVALGLTATTGEAQTEGTVPIIGPETETHPHEWEESANKPVQVETKRETTELCIVSPDHWRQTKPVVVHTTDSSVLLTHLLKQSLHIPDRLASQATTDKETTPQAKETSLGTIPHPPTGSDNRKGSTSDISPNAETAGRRRTPPTSSTQGRVSSPLLGDHLQRVPPSESWDYVKIATECLHAQDYSKMVQILSLIPLSETTDLDLTTAVEFGIGVALYKLKNNRSAVTHFSNLESCGKRQEPLGKGTVFIANFYLGEIDYVRGHYQEAVDHYVQAVLSYSSETVARTYRVVAPSVSSLYSKQASALRNISNVMAAVQAFKKAIATADSKRDKLAAHTSLGNLFQSLGENNSALAEYEQSIKLSEELQDKISLGWAHGNMGNAYLGLFQKDKALHHLEMSLELSVRYEPTPQSIGRAYNNLGTAFQAMNDTDKAQEYYDLALSQAIYGNDIAGQARVYGNIGNLLMIQKKYERAIMHYTETLAISNDKATRSTAYHNRGCAAYEKAENDRKQLLERLSISDQPVHGNSGLTYHGDGFEDIEIEHQAMILPDSILKQFRQARKDLGKVVDHHEQTFQSMKGSSKGLNLSVSLFESNSRTFHRLQDCLHCLGNWQQALVYAEQSRARTLGELLLQKKARHLDMQFTPPLDLGQITDIIKAQELDVIFISYTGARLLVWILSPTEDTVSHHMFQVALADDQFDGKSLDYYLRYSLTEQLVDKNMEMYAPCKYDTDEPSPVRKLHELFAKPLLRIFEKVREGRQDVRDVILIPDSYTNLMPIVALLGLNEGTREFLGDRFRFRIMPSLLTMGIMNQLPPVTVHIPQDSKSFCVVGNPTIPMFKHQNETWNLGKLPFATEEAEWVSHILKCTPTLHEQATKPVVISMISNAKVIHLATHGSAAAGFLAFAGLGSSRSSEAAEEKAVLLYPADIEHMNISPALVVLSSCDSGRGAVKADGIIGMARAFILAGAQAVLTTLWRVPDESAAVFMQFFYQYLMEGHQSSAALQKAILSLRCFIKYSGFIHWTGYQLTGREIKFEVEMSSEDRAVSIQTGPCSLFPRLEIVTKLQKVFITEPQSPTDVQIIQGSYGLKPSEPVIDFIVKYHSHFTGGVFWLNGSNSELIEAAMEGVRKVLSTPVASSHPRPILVVFDNILSLPAMETLSPLLLKSYNTHVIITTNYTAPVDSLRREIDLQLLRGCDVIPVKPLSVLHTAQRIVHSLVKDSHFTPFNEEQRILDQLSERSCGSPGIIDIASALLHKCKEESENGDFLKDFAELLTSAQEPQEKEDKLVDFTSKLIDGFQLPASEYFLLCSLVTFGPVPVPRALVEVVQSLVLTAKFGKHSREASYNPLSCLLSTKLLRIYPAAVIVTPQGVNGVQGTEAPFYYVPQVVFDALWLNMEEVDKVFSITTAYKALLQFGKEPLTDETSSELHFAVGLAKALVKLCDDNYSLINLNCYREAYRLYVSYKTKFMGSSSLSVTMLQETNS